MFCEGKKVDGVAAAELLLGTLFGGGMLVGKGFGGGDVEDHRVLAGSRLRFED